MKQLLLLFMTALAFYAHAQSDNDLPARTSYKLMLPVKRGSVYETDVTAVPFVQKESIVQIYPGETIYLEAEERNGKLVLKSVRAIKDSSKTIIVSCMQSVRNLKHENVMLKITNPFNKPLLYAAMMFPLNENNWVPTDVVPVEAKLTSLEMWPDMIITFALSNWQLSYN